MSREGRRIISALHDRIPQADVSALHLRVICDTIALRFSVDFGIKLTKDLNMDMFDSVLSKKSVFHDAPKNFSFLNFRESYEYVTEEYVTKDFSRIELLKLASICKAYDENIIERLGNDCKTRKKFTIPYLAAVLSSEAGDAIEELRQENRIEERIQKTKPLELGSIRPKNLSEKLSEINNERAFDRLFDKED